MALPHLVHDGENGYLFEPGDSDELAARLTDIFTMPEEKLVAMKRESLRLIEAHDIQRTLSTFESLYRGEAVTTAYAADDSDEPEVAASTPSER
jgi:glycosyltransferase involved in cell wall biosynthesis